MSASGGDFTDSFLTVAEVAELLKLNQQTVRNWIDAYEPNAPPSFPTEPGIDTENLLHAADIWWSVKKHWCIEAQRAIRASGAAS